MALSYIEYTGDGTTQDYNVPFGYISRSHVKLYLDDAEETAFTWLSSTQIRITSAPAADVAIKIARTSSRTTRLVTFENGATLDPETTLNLSALQLFYMAQEALDLSGSTPGPTGPQGPAGADGADGVDGVDGVDGADGADGADGIIPTDWAGVEIGNYKVKVVTVPGPTLTLSAALHMGALLYFTGECEVTVPDTLPAGFTASLLAATSDEISFIGDGLDYDATAFLPALRANKSIGALLSGVAGTVNLGGDLAVA